MNPYILQAVLINVGLAVVALVLLYVVIRVAVAHAIRSSELWKIDGRMERARASRTGASDGRGPAVAGRSEES